MNLLILGAGGHGELVKEIAVATGKYEKIDFLDDESQKAIGTLDELDVFSKNYQEGIVSMGDNPLRLKLLKQLQGKLRIPILIHPTAYVSASAKIGWGSIICPLAIIQSNVVIGVGSIISSGAIVDHDALIQDGAHINAGAIIKSGQVIDALAKIEP